MTRSPLRRRLAVVTVGLLTATLVPGLTQLPALAEDPAPAPANPSTIATIADPVHGLADVDTRGLVRPSAAQLQAATRLGATDLRWNAFGTPSSILPVDGVLAPATSADPVRTARTWLESNAALFGLSRAEMADLELVNDQKLAQTDARAVLFRQRFGDLVPAIGSMVTVGVAADGTISYVSSSLARTSATPPAAKLSPLEGWLEAATDVGLTDLNVAKITAVTQLGWTRLTVPGLAQEQQVRLRALANADGSVRPVLEANVVDVAGGATMAYTVLVDAVDGAVLHRQNQVANHQGVENFPGSFTATECGPRHAFELADDKTRSIVLSANALPVDDVTIKLYDPAGELIFGYDLATAPDTGVYTSERIPAGTYSAQVCPFDNASAVVGQYVLTVLTSDSAAPGAGTIAHEPKWSWFPANPTLDSPTQTPSNWSIGCWVRGSHDDCDTPPGEFRNVAAFGPWDTNANGIPTGTTVGNNANTHEAWVSPLTPGGLFQAPVSPTGDYTGEFTDAWNNSKCDPAQLTPGGNDINFSVGNLFVAHNRMHDYSYYLGFTESNYNMQSENGGRGGVPGDPEIGNAQAGGIGGLQHGLGRDNANQITLQDGVPGITNQYLFQPIAGAFYAPCTDGGLDMGIVGHEYTHAITNRMVGGPDEGLTSEHGGAMGESWGDLVAGEYQFAHDYDNGGNNWAIGLYATGNKERAIRDYAINANPLNFSDYGFDSTGPEVHADGEIWNGTQWEVRQALVRKWNKQYPVGNRALQLKCSQATAQQTPLRAEHCPGNRRWLQLMFDSFLLQQGATSMLDARDAMIAADRMRFRGANKKALWDAYARRGMGKGAHTPSPDSEHVKPSFASPTVRNARVTFKAPGGGQLFVGDYEARVTPVADTIKKTKLGKRVSFAPGRYRILYTAPNRAAKRFTLKVRAGERKRVKVRAPRNLAALAAGAKVIGSSADSRNAAFLLDGTEATNWGGVNADAANVDERSPFVAVDLAGKKARKIRKVNVSAMLNPAPPGPLDSLPVLVGEVDDDPDSGSRFTALRRFALEKCTRSCTTSKAKWKRFYTSPANAFPAVRPRPVAPDLIMRTFDVRNVKARAIRLVALENQCTGYSGYAGDQDSDPTNDTDCKTASDRGSIVHAAELQVW